MKYTIKICSLLGLCAILTGCLTTQSADGTNEPNWRLADVLADGILDSIFGTDDDDSEVDDLWHAGYGFNNPNNNRRRQNLPPLNFDGSVHKEK